MRIHEISRPLKLFALQLLAIRKNCLHRLLVNRVAPACSAQICERNAHEHIADRSGMQGARVV